ncbi:hypothetical protein WJX81_005824 [Elliptochloris bilobata]|uniref:Serine aminopeptidase S33 domain-containing protein n=1 Tax=Elliptochloris bilobata TaxID=381761 RepID=A0AAW1RGL9_9CHLO
MATGGVLAGAVLGLIYVFQEKLIYIPRIPGVPNTFPYLPDKFGLEYEDVWLTAADGTKLHAWYLYPRTLPSAAARRRRPAVLFLQENAGNMALRLPFLRLLVRYLDCAVLALSYRGYGLSQGSPSERGLQQDSQAALDHLLGRPDVHPRRVAVLGKSLGGAVALHVAATNPDRVAVVMVENTFLSIEDVAPKVLPLLAPFLGRGRVGNFLVRNKWRSYEAIQRCRHLPMLLLSSLQDEVLPPVHMRQLYEAVGGPACTTCQWVEFPEAHHMDTYEVAAQEYWPALIGFVQSCGILDDDAGEPDVARAAGAAAERRARAHSAAVLPGGNGSAQDGSEGQLVIRAKTERGREHVPPPPPPQSFGMGLYARYALAGALCCALTHGAVVPIDVVKTRMQLEPSVYAKGLLATAAHLVREEGLGVLTAGAGPTMVGYFLQGGLKFGGYEFWKDVLASAAGPAAVERFAALVHMVSSATAEFFADIALCPLEAVRIRLVAQPGYAAGAAGALTRLLREEGAARGLYAGFGPMLFKQIPYTVAKFVVFEHVARGLRAHVESMAGLVAGCVAALVSQPADMLLSRINRAKAAPGEEGTVARLLAIARELGAAGLFAGLGARMVMVSALTASQFAVYGDLKRLLGIEAIH